MQRPERTPAPAPERGGVAVAPRLLEPILGLVERIDRAIRRIQPIRPGSVLGIERHRYRGAPITLRDGTTIRRGDRVDEIHFDNRRVRQMAVSGWQLDGLRECRDELRLLATRIGTDPAFDAPRAYHGTTLLAVLARRIGFEMRPHRGRWSWLETWYARTILVRWSREGRGRVLHGHGRLQLGEVWISTRRLVALHGPDAEPPQPPISASPGDQ